MQTNNNAGLSGSTDSDSLALIASGGNCTPCQQTAATGAELSTGTLRAAVDASDPAELPSAWEGTLVMEGTFTGDSRMFELNSIVWDDLPIPLRWVKSDVGAHDNAVTVGQITQIERRDGGVIWAKGNFDLASEEGREAARQVQSNITNGVSVDMDDVAFEIRVLSELMEEQPNEQPVVDENGYVAVVAVNPMDEIMVTTAGRIRAATLVAIPAFVEARIFASDSVEVIDSEIEDDDIVDLEEDPGLVAGAAVLPFSLEYPPRAWFANPNFDEPQPLTVTEDGRVYGHLALWDTCHLSYGSRCVTPPKSDTNYALFRTGAILTDNGEEIAVGAITLNTLHANERMSAADTAAHYEHTGMVTALVAAGEDEHGIWLAGSIKQGATDEQIRSLRAAPLSGDWRLVGSNLELVAVLAVNVPGFPIPRPKGLVAGGRVKSLTAAGMVAPRTSEVGGGTSGLSDDDVRYLARLADKERKADLAVKENARQVAVRVRAAALKDKVNNPGN